MRRAATLALPGRANLADTCRSTLSRCSLLLRWGTPTPHFHPAAITRPSVSRLWRSARPTAAGSVVRGGPADCSHPASSGTIEPLPLLAWSIARSAAHATPPHLGLMGSPWLESRHEQGDIRRVVRRLACQRVRRRREGGEREDHTEQPKTPAVYPTPTQQYSGQLLMGRKLVTTAPKKLATT